MNKTVTINISGVIFHIEEDAFDKLSKYLGTIKSYFKDSDGRDEIMGDIEARIAELLKEKVSDHKQVVLMTDVDHVISVMGKPEDYASETETAQEKKETKEEENAEPGSKKRRRVFRDPDDKVLGGVCSGISNYFDIDPLWLRLSLIIFTLLGGAGIIIYIILWIVIPKAKTTAEKLEMKGEKVNVNSIKKSVEEEMEHFKKKGKDFEQEAKNVASPENRQKIRSGTDKFLDFLASVGTSFIKVFAKIFAVVIIIVGVSLSIALLTSVFGVSNFGWSNANEWMSVFFEDNSQFDLAIIALLLIVGIPFMMLVYGGFRMLLGIQVKNRMIQVISSSLWFIGLILGLYITVDVVTEFTEEGSTREVITLSTKSDTLYLRGTEVPEEVFEDTRLRRHIHRSSNNSNWQFVNMDEKTLRFGYPDISLERSQNDSFHVEIIRYSYGTDKKTALNLARSIRYPQPVITDSIVEFTGVAEFDVTQKWRGQDVKIIIRVPKGRSVFLSKSLKPYLYDVDNVHDVYDGDMLNRAWIMTDEGLNCGTCEGLDLNSKEVHIDQDEIHIRDEDKEIHIEKKDSPSAPSGNKPSVEMNDLNDQEFSLGLPLLRSLIKG